MPDRMRTQETAAEALRQTAAEERRLIERERRAEQRLARARVKLIVAEHKLARAQARLVRRTADLAEAEARLRRRQTLRAAGPALAGAGTPAGTHLPPSHIVDMVNETPPAPNPTFSDPSADGTEAEEVLVPPRHSCSKRPPEHQR